MALNSFFLTVILFNILERTLQCKTNLKKKPLKSRILKFSNVTYKAATVYKTGIQVTCQFILVLDYFNSSKTCTTLTSLIKG